VSKPLSFLAVVATRARYAPSGCATATPRKTPGAGEVRPIRLGDGDRS
jgi:hypothetical protein